jgi:hypothetical protein
MGSYAESLLSDGEVVIMRQRQHPLSLFLDARSAVGLWIVGIILLVAIVFFNIQGSSGQIVGGAALVAIVLGILIFSWNWWHCRTEEYMVTNLRLMKLSGIVNKESADSSLEKINDAILQQNLFARMFDYGDLEILTAAEVSVDRYHMLNHAKAFKIEMLNAKHSLEHEMSYVAMPSPPLRATPTLPPNPPPAPSPAVAMPSPPPMTTAPDATAPPAMTPPQVVPGAASDSALASSLTMGSAAAPAGTQAIDTPDEVTGALSRLADLRDRGAITPEDYEAKKAELLARL